MAAKVDTTIKSVDGNDIEEVNSIVTTCRSKGVTSESVWVQKTYGMVMEGTQTHPSVLSWTEDGMEFEIRDCETLKKTLFTKYHGTTKFESFLRRLRRYGFHRVKTEAIVKTDGKGPVLLSFRHENFQRDKPELLGDVTIVSQQSEKAKSPDEKRDLTSSLEALERNLLELKAELKQFETHSQDQKNRIDHLRQEVISKDEVIRRLEFRLDRLENTALMAMDPTPLRYHSLWEISGSKSTPGTTLREREISAIDMLPFFEVTSLPCDEPTLPRSKKMKISHVGKIFDDGVGRIALSRQTTPMFWGPLSLAA